MAGFERALALVAFLVLRGVDDRAELLDGVDAVLGELAPVAREDCLVGDAGVDGVANCRVLLRHRPDREARFARGVAVFPAALSAAASARRLGGLRVERLHLGDERFDSVDDVVGVARRLLLGAGAHGVIETAAAVEHFADEHQRPAGVAFAVAHRGVQGVELLPVLAEHEGDEDARGEVLLGDGAEAGAATRLPRDAAERLHLAAGELGDLVAAFRLGRPTLHQLALHVPDLGGEDVNAVEETWTAGNFGGYCV